MSTLLTKPKPTLSPNQLQKIEARIAKLTRWMNNPVISFQMSDAKAEEVTSEYFDLTNALSQLKKAA